MARRGGGLFPGEDPSKVDRSGAYAAARGREERRRGWPHHALRSADAYAIGVAKPISVMVETFGTEKERRDVIERFVDERFDLRPGAIREILQLQRPIHSPTVAYGHFGRDDPGFTWEHTGRAPF